MCTFTDSELNNSEREREVLVQSDCNETVNDGLFICVCARVYIIYIYI